MVVFIFLRTSLHPFASTIPRPMAAHHPSPRHPRALGDSNHLAGTSRSLLVLLSSTASTRLMPSGRTISQVIPLSSIFKTQESSPPLESFRRFQYSSTLPNTTALSRPKAAACSFCQMILFAHLYHPPLPWAILVTSRLSLGLQLS